LKGAIAKDQRVEQAFEKIVSTYWGTFLQLEEAERTEWIAAVYAAQILAEGQEGLATAWLRHAGVAFLAVAEAQLRRRVFAPILQEANCWDTPRSSRRERYIHHTLAELSKAAAVLETGGVFDPMSDPKVGRSPKAEPILPTDESSVH
jgi:hypothetical protein